MQKNRERRAAGPRGPKFTERVTTVRGVPNKHRRIERLRQNLVDAMTTILVRRTLPTTVGQLKVIYGLARTHFKDRTYVEMRNVRFGTDGYPTFNPVH